jgi:molybdopterin converting factor small subunit
MKVNIPDLLKKLTEGKKEIELEAKTIPEMVKGLVKRYPGLQDKFYSSEGKIKEHLRFYVGQDFIGLADYETFTLNQDSKIFIIVPLAGG